ncbi:hypothetical protein, partial [Bathymodiolus platifrons methanotrophic gill symbiont]|uniref:hypothetical protein n=1 Tax=Bathymodiolus platifrons methanotrophic gill symbiont TaxID=113268 RepID=UPI001C8DAE2E
RTYLKIEQISILICSREFCTKEMILSVINKESLHEDRGVPTFAKAHFGRPSPSSRQKLNGTD